MEKTKITTNEVDCVMVHVDAVALSKQTFHKNRCIFLCAVVKVWRSVRPQRLNAGVVNPGSGVSRDYEAQETELRRFLLQLTSSLL